MKKILSLSFIICSFLLIFFLQFHFLESKIEEINSFQEIDFEKIEKNKNLLVIFDVDQTLIQPTDAYLMHEQTPRGALFRHQLLKKYPTIQDWETIASIMVKEADRPLIEPKVIHHINTLKSNKIPVIACTAMNSGPYGILSSMEQWRYEHLKSLGFEGSFNDKVFKLTLDIHDKPVFYKGVLATDGAPKGPVIGAFLDEMKLSTGEIIMFDDCFEFLMSVQQECNQRGIIFKGYLYKGASRIKNKPWDEKLFSLQADYLIRNRIWLDDVAAQRFLATCGDIHGDANTIH